MYDHAVHFSFMTPFLRGELVIQEGVLLLSLFLRKQTKVECKITYLLCSSVHFLILNKIAILAANINGW